MNNRSFPPIARAHGAHECNVCHLPATTEAESPSVKFEHPTFVICITCLTAANEVMKNVPAHSVDPVRTPYS